MIWTETTNCILAAGRRHCCGSGLGLCEEFGSPAATLPIPTTKPKPQNKKPLQRQVDVFKKQQVEISAVETTIKYFEGLDYIIISKEKDNVGWDLEATNINETLLLEVKGLSGSISSIELTPNEYENSKEKKTHYKLCIVTNALTKPKLEIFSFNFDLDVWTNDLNEKLLTEERVAARMWKE